MIAFDVAGTQVAHPFIMDDTMPFLVANVPNPGVFIFITTQNDTVAPPVPSSVTVDGIQATLLVAYDPAIPSTLKLYLYYIPVTAGAHLIHVVGPGNTFPRLFRYAISYAVYNGIDAN